MIEESENARANDQSKMPVNGEDDTNPFDKNAQKSKVLSKTDENNRINSLIAKNFPELLFLAQNPSKKHFDIDELKESIKTELRYAYIPDPTTEILNPDVNDIKFVGYHSTETTKQPVEPEKETYEQWLSQHKAIIMSSRKENRQSKAPSLKDVKEAERTKYIRLDVNAVLKKDKEDQKDEVTPIETKTYKTTKKTTAKESSKKQLKDDDDIASQKTFFDLTIRKNIKDTPTEMFRKRDQKSKEKDDKKSGKKQETDNYFGKLPDPEK